MTLDVAAVQAALREDGLDGWLLYDFRGLNPIAARLAGLAGTGVIASRRWYYLIPREGTPRKLVHAIERHNLDGLPGETIVYAGRNALDEGLTALVRDARRVAMEYSPDCNIPYLARIDAGTIDTLRARGLDIVSSGDLVQRFEAAWDGAALATHREASSRLYRVKDRTLAFLRDRVAADQPLTELDVQAEMVASSRTRGSSATARRSSRPRRTRPTRTTFRPPRGIAGSARRRCSSSISGASSKSLAPFSPISRG